MGQLARCVVDEHLDVENLCRENLARRGGSGPVEATVGHDG